MLDTRPPLLKPLKLMGLKATGSPSLYGPYTSFDAESKAHYLGAANRSPDKCEADPSAARAINTTASRLLARATSARAILLLYISTDYVFSGARGDAPYENDTPTSPPNLYGQTKLDGESSVLEETADTRLGLVLRIPVLYGHAENSQESAVNVLLDAVWKAQDKGAQISMDDWALRYPTNTEDVGRVCQDVAVKYLETGSGRSSLPRILQFSSEDRYTKYEICELLAEIMGLPLDGMVRNKHGNAPSGGVQRPYDTHLSTRALKKLGIDVQTQNFKDWWLVRQTPQATKLILTAKQETGGSSNAEIDIDAMRPVVTRMTCNEQVFFVAQAQSICIVIPSTGKVGSQMPARVLVESRICIDVGRANAVT